MNYEKLLIKAKEAYNKCATNAEKRRLETIFPELKESEDERIRKALIKIINGIYQDEVDYAFVEDGVSYEQLFSWLEKQDDYNRLVEEIKRRKELLSEEKEKAKSANDKVSLGGRIAMLEELLVFANKKQSEQKSAEYIKDEALSKLLNKVICYFINNPNIPYSERDEVSVKLIPYVETLEKQGEQKLVDWSEKDNLILQRIIQDLVSLSYECQVDFNDKLNWLKSLKNRVQPHWKPTEEQMENLEYAINMVDKCCEDSLQSLYNDLKKL